MFALEGMMNAQRNRGMYLRVGERLAEIRKSRKLAKLRSEYDPELRARTQQPKHNAPI
jgi:hypothetical protein